MAKNPGRALYDEVVKNSVTAVLKPAGFQKKSTWFHRRHGATSQVVNLQGSASSPFESYFYINVAVRFDELCVHLGIDHSDERLDSFMGDDRVGGRLERFLPDVPQHWILTSADIPDGSISRRRPGDVPSSDVPAVLRSKIDALLTDMDGLDSLERLRRHSWFGQSSLQTRAVTLHRLGETEEALSVCDEICAAQLAHMERTGKHDRLPLTKQSFWVEQLGLSNP